MIASVWLGQSLKCYRVYVNNHEGHTAFRDFISTYAQANTYVVVDTTDEAYRLERLPHTNGRDRAALLQRKLQQFYHHHHFRAAHLIKAKLNKPSKDSRRTDQVLFVGLSHADYLQDWLDLLQYQTMVGVYLLPMLSPYLLSQKYVVANNILLCEQLSSGFRQSYFSYGELVLSRLIPENSKSSLSFYLQEIEKTSLYLHSQRMIASPHDLLLLWYGNDANSLAEDIADKLNISFQINEDIIHKKSPTIPPGLLKQYPEFAHMQCLAFGHTPVNLAPESLTRSYKLKQQRKLIYSSTFLISVLGLLVSAYLLWLANNNAMEVAQQQKQIQQYALTDKSVAANIISSSALKARVQLAQNITQLSEASPKILMILLSQALTILPEISLHSLYWQHSPDVVDKPNVQTAILQVQNYQSGWRQSALLSLHIANVSDDKAAVDVIGKLVHLLQTNPDVEQVTLLPQPDNTHASEQGHINADYHKPTMVFKLQLIMRSANSNVADKNAF
jgi:hypothetical protein